MSLKRNLIANYFGQGWTALMQLAFIPIYIHYLGLESYGLIGLFAVLQSTLTLLDLGMTPVLNREMARFRAGSHTIQSIRDLLRSIELITLVLAILIVIVGTSSAIWITENWLQAKALPPETVSNAIAIMAFVASLRFVEGIYRGALLGLQTQVWLNVVTSFFATVRGLGAVGILIFVLPSIEAFFIWQGGISLLLVITLCSKVNKEIPKHECRARFSIKALANVWEFTKGMIATTFLSLILTQVDKLLLSRMLNLESFGVYVLASTVANALMFLVVPLAQSYYPVYTTMVTKRDQEGLVRVYHQSCQLMAVIMMPLALLLMFAGERILFVWTDNLSLAEKTAPLLQLLSVGTAMLGLMNLPYMLQLANGWSMFAAKVNGIIVLFQLPALYWATANYGAIGAAWVWVGITASYMFIVIPLMHRHLLPEEKWHWYFNDNLPPISAAALTGLFLLEALPHPSSKILETIFIFFSGAAMVLAAASFSPSVRKQLVDLYKRTLPH